MTDIYTINEITKKLYPIFKNLPIEKAILFGSYAKSKPTHSSDIDILIDSKGKIKGIDFFGILEDMTEILDKPVDLIEYSQVIQGGKMQYEIEKTGISIYERKQ